MPPTPDPFAELQTSISGEPPTIYPTASVAVSGSYQNITLTSASLTADVFYRVKLIGGESYGMRGTVVGYSTSTSVLRIASLSAWATASTLMSLWKISTATSTRAVASAIVSGSGTLAEIIITSSAGPNWPFADITVIDLQGLHGSPTAIPQGRYHATRKGDLPRTYSLVGISGASDGTHTSLGGTARSGDRFEPRSLIPGGGTIAEGVGTITPDPFALVTP